ncbi:histidine kinase, partial [Lachnotalea glycerini]
MGMITLMNDSTFHILKLQSFAYKEEMMGQSLENIIPNTGLLHVLDTGKAELDDEQRLNNTVIVMNRIPIIHQGEVVGAIASIRDKTEVIKMAEELTGAKKMAWSLRAQNHEFMNKLHTISGLIQLNEYEEALQFISEVAKVRSNISNILAQNMKDRFLSALLLAKYNKAEEARVKLRIDKASKLANLPQNMTSQEIVSIVGNLIENALDAVKNDGTGEMLVKILEDDQFLN